MPETERILVMGVGNPLMRDDGAGPRVVELLLSAYRFPEHVEVIDAEARVARVIVPDYQLSLAIGKEGQNARLAARLTGWRIDIRPDTENGSSSEGEHAAGPADAPTR